MERLGQLLPRQPGGSLWRAAGSVSAVSNAIKDRFPELARDLRVTSVKNQTAYVRVNHSAVAGKLRLYQSEIIEAANRQIRTKNLGYEIKTIVARIG